MMRKLMIGANIIMAVLLVIGISWGKLYKMGYNQDEYGAELSKCDQKIEE